MKSVLVFAMLFVISTSLAAEPGLTAQDSTLAPNVSVKVSIKEIMESVITPMTNILWEGEEPQTQEEWQRLEDAAIAVIAAGAIINSGGSGPSDNSWAQDPAWRAFSDTMINASLDTLKAIRDKDFEAFYEASDSIYPPCEGCHLRFNPGVINQ